MKKVLFDTSFLVAAIVEHDDFHEAAEQSYTRALDGEFLAYMSAHSYAELYNTLTIYRTTPKIPPSTAWLLIQQCIDDFIEVISLSVKDYRDVLTKMSGLGIRGGSVYDAVIAKAAEIAGVDEIITFNPRHFKMVWPEAYDKVKVPLA